MIIAKITRNPRLPFQQKNNKQLFQYTFQFPHLKKLYKFNYYNVTMADIFDIKICIKSLNLIQNSEHFRISFQFCYNF